MKRTRTPFRICANMAKQRLKQGFWDKNNIGRVNIESLNNPNGEDEQLYRKVVSILQGGEINPLGECLDQEYMQTLDDASRQRYVLNIAQKVNQSIERYNACC